MPQALSGTSSIRRRKYNNKKYRQSGLLRYRSASAAQVATTALKTGRKAPYRVLALGRAKHCPFGLHPLRTKRSLGTPVCCDSSVPFMASGCNPFPNFVVGPNRIADLGKGMPFPPSPIPRSAQFQLLVRKTELRYPLSPYDSDL